MQLKETEHLHELPKSKVPHETQGKVQKRALKVVRQSREMDGADREYSSGKLSRLQAYRQINVDYNNAGSTIGARGGHFLFSKVTFNVCERVRERLQFPKYSIRYKKSEMNEDEDRKRIELAIIKSGLEYVLREGGLRRIFDGKGGVKFRLALYGDAMIVVESMDDKETPVNFKILPIDRVYVNPGAISMRGAATGDNVRQLAYIMDYEDYDTFMEDFKDQPGFKDLDKVNWGDIPQSENGFDRLAYTNGQWTVTETGRKGQVMVYFDLDMETYAIMAGQNAKIIYEKKEKEYPFKLKKGGKEYPYIPICHLFARERADGFWNMGFGHLSSEINQADTFIKNQYMLSLLKAVNPLDFITVKSGKEHELQLAVEVARMDVMQGRHGLVINKVDEMGDPAFSNLQKMSSGDPSQAYERFNSVITDRDIIGVGFNTQDVATPASKTATAVEAEQIAAEAAIQVITEQNSAEYRFLLEVTIDHIRKFCKNSKVPIDTSDIRLSDKIIEQAAEGYSEAMVEKLRPELEKIVKDTTLKGWTLGDVADLLKQSEIDVDIDTSTGLKATNTRRIQEKRAALELVMGTKAAPRIQQELLEELGTSIPLKELQPPEQQAPPSAQAPGMMPKQQATMPEELPV